MLKDSMDLFEVVNTTIRLRLVPISLKYAEEIFREFNEEITVFMNPVPAQDIHETELFITKAIQNMRESKELVCAILNKETQEFLGLVGIHEINTAAPELGIWIKKLAHGNHYGREAVHALKGWADEHLEYEYMHYPVATENKASRKIAESLGGIVVREYTKTTMSGKKLSYVDYRIDRSLT